MSSQETSPKLHENFDPEEIKALYDLRQIVSGHPGYMMETSTPITIDGLPTVESLQIYHKTLQEAQMVFLNTQQTLEKPEKAAKGNVFSRILTAVNELFIPKKSVSVLAVKVGKSSQRSHYTI